MKDMVMRICGKEKMFGVLRMNSTIRDVGELWGYVAFSGFQVFKQNRFWVLFEAEWCPGREDAS